MKTMPNPGRLREAIAVKIMPEGQREFVHYCQMYAELIPETGREVERAQKTQAEATVRFRMRFNGLLARIDPRRVKICHEKDSYNVTYIEDDGYQHVQLYMVAQREYD